MISGIVGRGRADGDAALELGDGAPEGLGERVAARFAGRVVRDIDRRDDLGVGGDRGGDAQVVR